MQAVREYYHLCRNNIIIYAGVILFSMQEVLQIIRDMYIAVELSGRPIIRVVSHL